MFLNQENLFPTKLAYLTKTMFCKEEQTKFLLLTSNTVPALAHSK